MNNTSLRDQELELLEAAGADEWSSQFEILMTTFDLGLEYREVLSAALVTADWRSSPRPLKTIHGAILGAVFGTKAKKSRKGASVGLSTAEIGVLAYHTETLETLRGKDGVWRQGGGRDPLRADDSPRSYHKDDLEFFFGPGLLIGRVRPEFIRTVDSQKHVDLDAALKRAGLDDFEITVFRRCMGRHRGQSKTIADYMEDGCSQKEIEAAIKRVRRKLPRIRAIVFRDTISTGDECPSSPVNGE
jgi:hypothetical protein